MIEHIVLIKRKPGVPDSDIEPVLEALRALKAKIPGILEMTAGTNFCERSGGYTHALYARLVDRAALDAYFPHPEHQAIIPRLAEVSESRLVVDYEI